jgi:oligopeptide transport system substrate-binding protein
VRAQAGGAQPLVAELPEGAGGDLVDLYNFAQGDPDHIDPALAGVVQGAQITEMLFDGLTTDDPETSEIVPSVAESWESNADGDEWTFQIREGVTFTNGDPVLPSNFKCGWERAAHPSVASEIAYHFSTIQGYDQLSEGNASELTGVVADDDAMTLTVSLTAAFADFPAVVSHTIYSPVPKSEIADLGDAQTDWEQGLMIGNGPFKLAEAWQSGQYIRLERNDDYWGGPEDQLAYLDTIEFRISQDVDSAYNEFEAGGGQTALIPPGRFAEATGNYANSTDAALIVYHFFINQEDDVVGGEENRLLRQAISLAIDRDAINNAVYDGSRQNATGITPPGIPGHEADLCEYCTFDLDRAQQLMEEWGGEITEPIQIQFNADSGHEPVVQIIQQNLEAIGIPSELDGRDPQTYFSDLRAGDCQICRAGWAWDYAVMDNGLYPLFHSSTIDGDNIGRYSNPEFDSLVEEARQTIDDDERQDLYRQAEALMLEDLPAIPVNWYTNQVVYTDDIAEFVQNPRGFISYQLVRMAQ